MARIAGIPSRYVEGFVVPPTREPTVAITNRMAHAWAEVYLEGFGWHIMEATPTYAFMIDPEIIIPPTGGFDYGFYDEEWLEMMRLMMYEDWVPGQGMPPGWGAFDRPPGEEQYTPAADAFQFRPWFLLGTVPLAAAAFFIFLWVRVLGINAKKRRISQMGANAQVRAYFSAVMHISCTHTKRHVETGETIHQYGQRMGGRFAFKSDSVFLRDLIALYYKARYAPVEVSEEERALMQGCYEEMMELMTYVNRRRFFIWYYLRGIGNLPV
jgi:hypothetical protein